MHLLDYINARPTTWLDDLVNEYSITVVRDGDLVSLKYNQFESPMHEPIVQECRGVVVSTRNNTILAWPYNKFWNYGESLAAEIDWSAALVLEKLDGSLAIVFHDPDHTENGGWRMATSGHPTGGGKFGNTDETFSQAFWRTWYELGMYLPEDKDITYMFEFCAEPNRVVVKHNKPRIVLHGARDTSVGTPHFGMEFRRYLGDLGEHYNWEVVKSYPLDTIDACLAAAEALNPVETEGFVVVDENFNRVKIKSPSYILLHRLKGNLGMTITRALELWQSGDPEEVLVQFPEFREKYHDTISDLQTIISNIVTCHNCYALLDRKDYAAKVISLPFAWVCFKLFGKSHSEVVDVETILMKAPISKLKLLISDVSST